MQLDHDSGFQEPKLPEHKTLTERSQELWGRLRKEYRHLAIQMRRADMQPTVLVHGVQLLRRFTVPVPLLYATHISEQKSLVSVDSAGTLRLHYEDGQLRDTRQLGSPFFGLLYACQVQQYVAWNQQELLLFDSSFMLLSRSPVQQGVSSCVYHPGENLVFTGGYGGVIVWSFGHKRQGLVQQASLCQGMTDMDKVNVLTIDTKSPHVQTCNAACGTSVWEYDLSDGTLRRVRRHLHERWISSLLYSEQLHLLISGSRDGSIKAWDNAGQLVAVYLGHTGTLLVSGSEDASLRTWDLATQEQVDEQRVSGSLLGLSAFYSNGDHIVSYSSHELHVWQMQHLYELHSLLGTAVTALTVSEEVIPSSVLCVCADTTVRLISSATGELIAALDGGDLLLGAEYCAPQGTVCALLGDGQLLKASALTNPMHVVSRVKVSSSQSLPCCFCLFYIVDKEAAVADSKAAGKKQQDEGSKKKAHLLNMEKQRLFCMIGLSDGSLQVYNWYSNQPQYETKAHSPGKVTCLMSNPENHYIISAGSDRMVKVWRFYLYSEESLSLCMSFYCAQQVGQMCCLDSQLFVAFHDPSSATYTLVQYCLKTGARSDHPPIHDHQDQITGLCASPELGLVASCGRDRVIRIWTEKNRLLRLLRLNASPESLSFCSSQGELLVGIHRDIYRIHLMRLLPQPYKLKIMCLAPPSAVSDLTCPPDGSNLLSFSMEDIQKLPQPCGLTHRTSVSCFHDVEKNGQKEEECRLLSTRDRELHLLQMGKLRSRKRMKGNKETRREAMEKYLQLIYQKKPGFTIPEEDNFDPEELLMASGVQEPNKIPFVPLKNNRGFFTDSALGFSIDSLPKHLQTSFLAAGVFPNSALLQLLWPMNIEETLRPIKRRNFTQLVESSGKTPEVEIEKMSKETKEMIEETTEETDDVDEIPSFLQDILALVNTKNESPPVPETSLLPLQSPPAQSYKLPKPTRPQITRLSRIPRPHPVQTKEPAISVELSPPADLVDKPYVSSASLQEDELHVKNPDMSEIPEMPQFILQFQDQSWFSLVLPQAEQPQYHEFESRLLRTFLQAGQPMCTQLLHALRTLHQQGHLKDPQQVFQTLRDAINRGGDLTVHEEQEFVWLCLHFMNDLSRDSRELIVELLVTCVQLQPSHRGRFIALFHEFGVHDPHGFIAKKCNSWDNWDETGNSRETLKQICEDWLHQWTVRLMDHLQAETTWNKESWASHGGRSMKCQKVRSLGGNRATHKDRRECLPCDVTPVDVLNYYCDVQMKRELQMLKDCEPEHGSTVLALPPIDRRRALLRLGETGLHGRQKVQTGRSFPTVRPLFRSDVFPCINLPVKKVTLSPFIGTEDIPTRTHFIGSLRQDIHRYFIVQQSYTERY
ncbi:WD repeat-containing protein 97 isoform X2 [Eleutherodactylus coqui]|uniref:WD repeat-containing protein 97 isoform X2 n=1 Tax=Eleutherodactylus coqui TaxID=57060 RepID=UPI003462F5E4